MSTRIQPGDTVRVINPASSYCQRTGKVVEWDGRSYAVAGLHKWPLHFLPKELEKAQ